MCMQDISKACYVNNTKVIQDNALNGIQTTRFPMKNSPRSMKHIPIKILQTFSKRKSSKEQKNSPQKRYAKVKQPKDCNPKTIK